jgi:hypothetical protein
MCKVKAKIKKGAEQSERIAYIKTSEGEHAEVLLNSAQTGINHIVAAEIARDNNNVLIELPQETSSGYRRVWVNKNQILGS